MGAVTTTRATLAAAAAAGSGLGSGARAGAVAGVENEGFSKRSNKTGSAAGGGRALPVTGGDTGLGVLNLSTSPGAGGDAGERRGAEITGRGGDSIEGGFGEARPDAPRRNRSPWDAGQTPPAAEDGIPLSSECVVISPPPSQASSQQGHRYEALSEVVRLAMTMFDKICSPGERLDITLLTVGFAGFRKLGGGAQAGMARYVARPVQGACYDNVDLFGYNVVVVFTLIHYRHNQVRGHSTGCSHSGEQEYRR